MTTRKITFQFSSKFQPFTFTVSRLKRIAENLEFKQQNQEHHYRSKKSAETD